MSPYNFTQQVYSYGNKIKVVDVTIPIRSSDDVSQWTEFFDDLNGYENTFQMDLSGVYKHETGITAVEMRMVSPEVEWDLRTDNHMSVSFTAMEAI